MRVKKSNHLNLNTQVNKGRSLNKDLTIILVLIVSFVSMISIVFNFFYISHHERIRLEGLADEYLSYLKQSLEQPIWTLDYNNAVKIAESYFNNEQVESLRITEKNDESSNIFSDKVLFDRKKTDQGHILVRESNILHQGNIIGNIRLGLTRRIFQENLLQLLWSNIVTMLLTVLSLSLMTSILLRLFMKQPLETLMKGISQISQGNYDHPLKPVKQREFKSILSNFIFMANQIQRREKSLADVNQQLEIEVSQKNKAQNEMRQREAQLRAIFESSADGIIVLTDDGLIINANDNFYRMWQIPDALKNQDAESLVSKFLVEQLKYHDASKVNPEDIFRVSKEVLSEIYLKDGRVFERFSRPLILAGKTIGRVWNFRDITDRKRSFQALRESEARFRQLSDVALEAIVIHDNGIILQANEQFFKMFGHSRKEVIGKQRFIDCFSIEYHPLIEADNSNMHSLSFLEVEGVKKNGDKFPVVMRNREIIYYSKKVTVSIIRDISERKAAEKETQSLKEKLARSKKMEVLGLLAGGVAHDLNNILSGIVSYPELLLMKEGLDEHTRKALKTIQESGERVAAVVNDLTTISRGIASNNEPVNINTVIMEYLNSPEFQHLIQSHPHISVINELDPELFNIFGSRIHIRKCIMNLIINAYEAIEKEGKIVVSTSNCYLDEPLKVYSDIQIGEYALLTVFDSGMGISHEEIDRIFEPFYTKKVMGRSGTGLGLTVVWNTVEDHNGYINLTSGKDGTKFELYFPITRENVKESAVKMSLNEFVGNGEKILIVDDEKNQREIACQMLDSLGYKAQSVASGEAAFDYIRANPVDLIVLDMIMPQGMNGLETYKMIANYKPGQKAIIASGFSITEDVKAAQALGAGFFLKKPYSFEKLGTAVKQELMLS